MGAAARVPAKTSVGESVSLLPALQAHRLWAPVYDAQVNPLLVLEQRIAQELLGGLRPSLVIDIGVGTGRSLLRFADSGAQVIGIDPCEEMLTEAAHNPSLRTRLIAGEAESLPLTSGKADLVISAFAASYFPDLRRAFKEFGRIAKPGAIIATSDMHPDAMRAGWTRSFKVRDAFFEIEHRCCSLQDWHAASNAAGLRFMANRSACFDDPEFELFQEAGREDLWESVRQIPAVWFALWTKD
jgi:ubiquinone/menaquinone biosynthesis C-methylase UbiE